MLQKISIVADTYQYLQIISANYYYHNKLSTQTIILEPCFHINKTKLKLISLLPINWTKLIVYLAIK